MNPRLKKIQEYERECFKFLQKKFDKVIWNSLKNPIANIDFSCYKNNKLTLVDAKRLHLNKYVYISSKQKDCNLFILKVLNKFILVSRNDLINIYNFKIEISPNGTHCSINDNLHKEVNEIIKDKVEYPSIKNFVDRAIKEKLSREKRKNVKK